MVRLRRERPEDPQPRRSMPRPHARHTRRDTFDHRARAGGLSVRIARHRGVRPRGRPLFLLSRLAEHTRNLIHREDASLLITEPFDRKPSAEALTLARATILGPCRAVIDTERSEVRTMFLSAHPDASRYVDFADFAFYRLEPVALRYVGGFGQMSWVLAEQYAAAGP